MVKVFRKFQVGGSVRILVAMGRIQGFGALENNTNCQKVTRERRAALNMKTMATECDNNWLSIENMEVRT